MDLGRCADRVFAMLPLIFVCTALPLILFLAIKTPAFQTPDEPHHFYRAEQIAMGGIIGHRLGPTSSGGYVDANAVALADAMEPLAFNPERKFDSGMQVAVTELRWSGHLVLRSYPNTVIYPPILYIPAVVAIWLGKAADWTIADTLIMTRIFSGAVAVALSFFALRICKRGRVVLFAVLTLPMTLALFASCSQEAMMLGIAAMLVAMVSRSVAAGRSLANGEAWAMMVGVVLLATARVAYIGLAPLVLLCAPSWRRRLPQLVGTVVLTFAWYLVVERWVRVPMDSIVPDGRYISISEQIAYLITDPSRILSVAIETLRMFGERYLHLFIGQLGWVDTPLPSAFYSAATAILVAALMAELGSNRMPTPSERIVVGMAVLISATCVFGALYLTWNAVGSPVVRGVQGRYFLPLAMFAGLMLPALSTLRWWRWLVVLVAAFPLITLAVVPAVIMERFFI